MNLQSFWNKISILMIISIICSFGFASEVQAQTQVIPDFPITNLLLSDGQYPSYFWASENRLIFTQITSMESGPGGSPYDLIVYNPSTNKGSAIVTGGTLWRPMLNIKRDTIYYWFDGKPYISTLDNQTAHEIKTTNTIVKGAFSPDGSKLLYITENDDIWFNDVISGTEVFIGNIPSSHNPGGVWPEWSPDGKWIAVISNGRILLVPRNPISTFDFIEIGYFIEPQGEVSPNYHYIKWSDDSTNITTYTGSQYLVSSENGSIPTNSNNPISPDGNYYVSIRGNELYITNIKQNTSIQLTHNITNSTISNGITPLFEPMILAVADGFDYPVGKPDGNGYNPSANWTGEIAGCEYLQSDNGCGPLHPGVDFNGNGGGDTELNDPVYSVANGIVVASTYSSSAWGNVILVEHTLPDSSKVWSQYAHLNSRGKNVGDVVNKGDQIGVIGKGANNIYYAHLHFEIRTSNLSATFWPPNFSWTESQVRASYADPVNFINTHRTIGGGSCSNPSPNSDQVGLYTEKNYCGTAKIFNTGEWANPGAMGFPNDSASSVKVGSNVKAILCKDDNYGGGCDEFTGDDSDLTNNNIGTSTSSLKVQSRGSTSGSWTANYYDTVDRWWDTNNSGNFKCSENVGGPTLDKNYGTSGPCGMDGDTWTADYTAAINFPAGNYIFLSDHDDALKIWLNGSNIGDYGGSGSNDKTCPARYLNGPTNMRALLREDGGDARVKVWWTTDTSICVTPPSAPSLNSPANNATVGRYDNVVLSWNGVSGASEYYAEFSGGPGFAVNSGWTSSTSYTVGNTFWGGVYTWRVQARNSAGTGNWSESRTLYRKYGTPSNLTASAASQSQINLSWGASADAPGNIDGYRIYRNGSAVATVNGATTSYADNGLSCNTSYSYTIKAFKGSLESDASNSSSATTSGCQAGVPTLQSPDNGAYFNEGQSIVLSWTDTGDEFYGEVAGGPSLMSFGWQTATTKDLGSQWAGYQYSWHVKARNSVSASDYSANRTFIIRPGKPTNLAAASPSCSRVNLTWSDNSGNEQGYQVYRNNNLVATLGSNTISYQDNSVGGGTAYAYSVYAYRGSIQSESSDPANISTGVCPPGNDNRSSAYTVTSLPYTNTQSTRGATVESTEPVYPLGYQLGATVWYKFTPGTTGIYSFDTQGSDYDTVIHIFALGTSNNLTLLKGNDNDPVGGTNNSKSVITLNGGTNYFISIAHYNNTYGGNLTLDVQSIPCSSSSLCLTVTSPYYTGFSSRILVYGQNNQFIEWAYTDDYGFISLDDLTVGSYKIVATGANMVNVMKSISVPSIKYITGIGLPSVKMELKDPSSNPIDNRIYVGNDMDVFYLGNNPVEWGSNFYLSPDTYTFYLTGSSSNVLAITPYTISQSMDHTPLIYDLSQKPYKSITYNLDTLESVSLVTWVTDTFGFDFNTNKGMTTFISMPSEMELHANIVTTITDSTFGGTWDYWFAFPKWSIKLSQFREDENIQVGGALKINLLAHNSPYGFGDSGLFERRISDQYNHELVNIQYNQPSTTSISITSAREIKAIEGMISKPGAMENPTLDKNPGVQSIPPAITFTTNIYDPSNQLIDQNLNGSNFWGVYNFTIPNPAVTGQWRAEVTANHLGSYQGATTGSTTFEVKNTPPPSNDDIGSPIVITTKPYTNTQDTFGATQASDDPAMPMCNLNPAEATVWYRYTPAQSGVLSADTIGSDYDTVLAVWRGTRGNLTLIACNDDRSMDPHDQDSELVADLTAGVPYYIMAGKWTSDMGTSSITTTKSEDVSIQTMGAGTLQLHVDFLPSTPNIATLISPNSIMIHRTPTFVWSKASLATEYILSVWDENAQQVYSYAVNANDVCQAETCNFTPTNQLENGVYTWQIQTHNSNGFGPISTPMGFEIRSTESSEKKVYIPFVTK